MAKDTDGAQIPADIRAMSFEAALAALEEIVQSLEGAQVSLEDSIAAYTRGAHLKRHCEEKLRDAQARIEKIVVSPAGDAVGSEPVDLE